MRNESTRTAQCEDGPDAKPPVRPAKTPSFLASYIVPVVVVTSMIDLEDTYSQSLVNGNVVNVLETEILRRHVGGKVMDQDKTRLLRRAARDRVGRDINPRELPVASAQRDLPRRDSLLLFALKGPSQCA